MITRKYLVEIPIQIQFEEGREGPTEAQLQKEAKRIMNDLYVEGALAHCEGDDFRKDPGYVIWYRTLKTGRKVLPRA